jgi:beta-1,4-mannosyl-glycoprotein beta-1,4-N-acetylglucosaminyltransferase
VLDPVVDRFVIVEADRTHSNREKPFVFEENEERFRAFRDKIVYIKIDDYSDVDADDPVAMEARQRDRIADGLTDLADDDVVMISDLDEIPAPEAVVRYRDRIRRGVYSLEQAWFWYYLNLKNPNAPWHMGRIMSGKDYREIAMPPTDIRNRLMTLKIIPRAGWHFTWLGGVDAIQNKLRSFLHQEFNTEELRDQESIIRAVTEGRQLTGGGRLRLYPVKVAACAGFMEDALPLYVVENRDRYEHLILQKGPSPGDARNPVRIMAARVYLAIYKTAFRAFKAMPEGFQLWYRRKKGKAH